MTISVYRHLDNLNVGFITCHQVYDSRFNPFTGDTPCSSSLPVLCVSNSNFKRPPYAIAKELSFINSEYYHGFIMVAILNLHRLLEAAT